MKNDFDIVIVGGGLVGASLACALRHLGLRMAIVEAVPLKSDTQPSYDVQGRTTVAGGRMPGTTNERTVALAYGSRRIFDSVGVWAHVERFGATPIEHIHISHRGCFGVTRLDAGDLRLPALGYVVENRVLGAALWNTLEGASGVTWRCPATVTDIRATAAGACVTLKQGDRLSELSARLVVGADGANSAVRGILGIEAERIDYAQVAVVATVAAGLAHRHTAYERFTAAGPLAVLPMRANRLAIVWSVRPQEAQPLLDLDDDGFVAALQQHFGDRLGRFTQPGARTTYPLALTRVPQQLGTRVVLIGNAAHTLHPVAGQGLNLGLRDVAALAEVVVNATRAGEDIGDAAVLRRYADWRQRDTRATEMFTNGLIRLFANESTLLAWARGFGLVATDLMPPVKRRLLRMTSGLAGRLPRLARGLDLLSPDERSGAK